jgi:hypothetical protein
MGGKGEIVASIAAALFHQSDQKAAKQTMAAAAGSGPAQSLWKVSGRAGMERGW